MKMVITCVFCGATDPKIMVQSYDPKLGVCDECIQQCQDLIDPCTEEVEEVK